MSVMEGYSHGKKEETTFLFFVLFDLFKKKSDKIINFFVLLKFDK